MSTLMQILNLYATRDSQTKFEGNRMKNGKVHIFTCTIYSIYGEKLLKLNHAQHYDVLDFAQNGQNGSSYQVKEGSRCFLCQVAKFGLHRASKF